MAFKILNSCINCGECALACPMGCIFKGENTHEIDRSRCIDCGTCMAVCPVGAPVPED